MTYPVSVTGGAILSFTEALGCVQSVGSQRDVDRRMTLFMTVSPGGSPDVAPLEPKAFEVAETVWFPRLVFPSRLIDYGPLQGRI